MEVYIIIYLLLFISVFIKGFRRNSFYLYFCLLFFSILVGFRGEYVGDDTYNYMSIYRSFVNERYSGSNEVLFIFVNRIGAYFNLSFQIFQTLLLFFVLLFTAKAIRTISPDFSLSIFLLYTLFFVFYAMNIYRQMLSCFIAVSALPFLYYKPKYYRIKYICIILFATGIHTSALLMLPLMFLSFLKMRLSYIFLYLGVSLALGLVLPVESLVFFMGKYERIMNESGNERESIIKSVILASYWIIEFFLLYFFSNSDLRKSLFMKVMLVAVIVSNLLVQQGYGLRVMIYYNIVQILLVPLVIELSRYNKQLIRMIFVLYVSIILFVLLAINSATVVPYEFNLDY